MTFDIWFRYVILPAIGAAAAVALFISIREFWRDFKNGEL